MPVLFCFGVSMQTQVVRTLAWDFHPCPFLWTNNPAGYSAVAGSIIVGRYQRSFLERPRAGTYFIRNIIALSISAVL